MNKNEYIDYSDIPEIKNMSKCRKNPHVEKIKKEGYSITVHYSPEDLVNGKFNDSREIIQALVGLMTNEETKRLLLYIKDNYDLPCSPNVWDIIETQE